MSSPGDQDLARNPRRGPARALASRRGTTGERRDRFLQSLRHYSAHELRMSANRCSLAIDAALRPSVFGPTSPNGRLGTGVSQPGGRLGKSFTAHKASTRCQDEGVLTARLDYWNCPSATER